jgi:RNA polymerase-interacting CarD/CdnL/TRCF family regulator
VAKAFKAGDRLVVPLHGRGVVQAVERTSLPDGAEESCYVIALEGRRGGKVVIPATRAVEHGLRRPMSSKEVEGVMEVLAEPLAEDQDEEDFPSQTVFYGELKEELRTGQSVALARVVRRVYTFSLTNAITDIHLKELDRYAMSELVDELADADETTKAATLRTIRSTLKRATPRDLLR